MKLIDDESYLDIQMLQICLSASNTAEKFASKKNTFYSKDNI